MNVRKFDRLKLAAIKEFLSNHRDSLDDEMSHAIAEAKSIGAIWCLLFENELFDVYSDLRKEGISPSAAEMKEKNDDDKLLNPWFTLMGSDEGEAEFLRLVQQGILPDTQALAERRSRDNTSSWYWLAVSNIPLFKLLLQKNVLPSSAALGEQRTTDNTNGWFELCFEDGFDVFKELLQRNILPTVKALSALDKEDNTNGFFRLTGTESGEEILLELVTRNILPTVEALSVPCKIDNTNGFYWLTRREKSRKILLQLIKRNILPTVEALSAFDKNDNTNGFLGLASYDNNAEVLLELKNKGILPTTAALSEICTTNNTSGWFWLSHSPERIRFAADLMNNGISPTSAILDKRSSKDNTSFWYWLLQTQAGLETALLLIENRLWPDSETLSICTLGDKTCGWFWLLYDKNKQVKHLTRITLALGLIQKGIVPNQKLLRNMKLVISSTYIVEGESLLLEPINIPILQALLNLDIVPAGFSINKDSLKKLKEVSEKSDANDPIRKVVARLDRIKELEDIYSIGSYEHSDKMGAFLSRDDFKEFYGFFYLFYLATAKGSLQIGDLGIPLEMLLNIGTHLLAKTPELRKFSELDKPENRFAFAKYHLLHSLDDHKQTQNLFSLFNNKKENARLSSFRTAVTGTSSLTSFTKLITAQYFMAEHPKKFVKEPRERLPRQGSLLVFSVPRSIKKSDNLHLKPFESKASDDVVYLLRETSALVLK